MKDYAEFIEYLYEAEKNMKSLELSKIDIETMHSLLRKFD